MMILVSPGNKARGERQHTYSLGNSPRANEHSKDVLPQAPEEERESEQTGTAPGDIPSPTMTSFLLICQQGQGETLVVAQRCVVGTHRVLGGHGDEGAGIRGELSMVGVWAGAAGRAGTSRRGCGGRKGTEGWRSGEKR